MTTNIIKRIAFIICFSITLLTPTFAGSTTKGGDDVTVTTKTNCGVSDAQIVDYMGSMGYRVLKITPISGSCDVICTTDLPYHTRVIISGGAIIDYEDMPN